MAQALAEPGDIRHGFTYVSTSNYSFGRISGMACTAKGNVIICDNMENKLVLVDKNGHYLSHVCTEDKPWDVCTDRSNSAYVTFPLKKEMRQFYPDQLIDVAVLIGGKNNANCPIAVSEVVGNDDFGVLLRQPGNSFASTISCRTISNFYETTIENYVSKFHIRKTATQPVPGRERVICYHCLGSGDSFKYQLFEPTVLKYPFWDYGGYREHNKIGYDTKTHTIVIPTLQEPSDVCSDDYDHVYVSGLYSHNIHRIKEEGVIVDIPLTDQHGIKNPVAMCFSKDYTKFYVANEWGRSVLVYDVV